MKSGNDDDDGVGGLTKGVSSMDLGKPIKRVSSAFLVDLNDLKFNLEDAMSVMESTDFRGDSGLNECGFKMIAVSIIKSLDPKKELKIYSEYPLHTKHNSFDLTDNERYSNLMAAGISGNIKYPDILVRGEDRILAIEFKYIRLPFLIKSKSWLPENTVKDLRVSLSRTANSLRNLTESELLKLVYLSPEKKMYTVEKVLSSAVKKMSVYAERISKIWPKYTRYDTMVVLGIGNRVLIKRISFESQN